MMPRRRLLALISWALFALAVLGYLFWIPYDPAKVYRAIPASAALVSSHQNLANRWPSLATNIWLKPFWDTAEISALGQTAPRKHQMLSRVLSLARRDTIIAYLPNAPMGQSFGTNEAWMLSSWIGGWSTCLRWILPWSHWRGIEEVGECGGQTMWGLTTRSTDGLRISFAFGEGVLLVCLSRDPAAVRYALIAYDGLLPSTRAFSELRLITPMAAPDALWCQWRSRESSESFSAKGGSASGGTLCGAITRFDNHGLTAAAFLRPSPVRQKRLADSLDVAMVKQVFGNLPAFVVALPLSTVLDNLQAIPGSPAWLQTTRSFLQSDCIPQDSNAVVLALFTGEYGGAYGPKPLRVSVPVLMAFIRVGQPENVRALVDRELDLLNAQYRLGLIQHPTPLTAGAQKIWPIEITNPRTQGWLEAEDGPAYTLFNNWLIVSSQANSLARLLQRLPTQGKETLQPNTPWHTLLAEPNVAGLAWLDLDSGGKAARLALSLWALSQRRPDSPSPPPMIKSARTFLDQIRPLQSGLLWLESDGPDTILRVEIGPQAGKP